MRMVLDIDLSSKNYVKGRNFEYRVMKFLRMKGYYCMRAYGSKGLYDIIAIPPKPIVFDKLFSLLDLHLVFHLLYLLQRELIRGL